MEGNSFTSRNALKILVEDLRREGRVTTAKPQEWYNWSLERQAAASLLLKGEKKAKSSRCQCGGQKSEKEDCCLICAHILNPGKV